MADEHKSFVVHGDWAILLAGLPEEDVGEIIKSICSQKVGQEYEVKSQTAKAVLSMMTPQLEEDHAKYLEKVERLKRNTGRSKKKKIEIDSDIEPEIEPDMVNDIGDDVDANVGVDVDAKSVGDNVNVNVNDTLKRVYIKSSPNGDDCGTTAPRSSVQPIIDAWNSLPDPVPKITKLSNQSLRAKSLRARITQYGEDEVLRAIDNIKHSPFLLGQVKDFVISFDWFVKPNNFTKVLDGNYLAHDRPKPQEDTTAYLFRRIAEEEAKEKANAE